MTLDRNKATRGMYFSAKAMNIIYEKKTQDIVINKVSAQIAVLLHTLRESLPH